MTLLTAFEKAAAKLNVRVVRPIRVQIRSGKMVLADVFFPAYGAEKGTLVFPLEDQLLPEADELMAEGYAVSLVDVSPEHPAYSTDELAALLRDWGWCGSLEEKPSWLG